MRMILLILTCLFAGNALARGDVYRMVAFGDFNGPYGTAGYRTAVLDALNGIIALQPDLVLFTGDLIAGQDRNLPADRFAEMWQAFDEQIAAPLRAAGIAHAATLGNHDGSSLLDGGEFSYARERAAAADYWNGRLAQLGVTPLDVAGYPFNWSFSAGGVFVMVWDASSSQLAPDATAWVLEQLASPAAAQATQRLLLGHLPLFGISEGRDRPGEVLPDGAGLATRLAAAGLDTYVSGHQAAWYPGSHAGLELLMNGGIGARRLLGTDLAPQSGISIMDIGPDGISYSGVNPETLTPLDPLQLPASLDAFGGTVYLSCRLPENPACGQ